MKKYAIWENDENSSSSLILTDNLQKDFIEFYQIEWDEDFSSGKRIPDISGVRRRPGAYEYVVCVFTIDPNTSKTNNILECNFFQDGWWQDEVEGFIREHWIELSRQTLESVENIDEEPIEIEDENRILKFGEVDKKPSSVKLKINNPPVTIHKWATY